MSKHCSFCKESTKITGWVHFDTSMNIRYAGMCEINAESQKVKISDILRRLNTVFYIKWKIHDLDPYFWTFIT